MTDQVLLPAAFGGTAPADDVAVIPGWGPLPGAEARAHIKNILDHASHGTAADDTSRDDASVVWLRRLFTDPTGRDLVALDSKRRLFQGGLRRFLELRDPTCRVPWCDAPAVQTDHAKPAHAGGATHAANGGGLCQRHNLVKEGTGWHFRVQSTGLDGTGSHTIRITTPSGQVHDATAPPILGEGWSPPIRARDVDVRSDDLRSDADLGYDLEPTPDQERFAEEFGDWLDHAHEGHYWAA